ncbi:hypothetical protein ACJX0J_034911, partial [Zea mays]
SPAHSVFLDCATFLLTRYSEKERAAIPPFLLPLEIAHLDNTLVHCLKKYEALIAMWFMRQLKADRSIHDYE